MVKQLEITLVKSLIGRVPNHKRTAKALGLNRLNNTVVVKDSPQVRGMIKSIEYMVDFREIGE